MRLSNTPPKGAGKSQGVTLTDKLLAVIDGLGTDKYGNPVGIRSPALSEASGVPAKSITALLASAVTRGRVVVCKITIPGASAQNEYRKGGGLPPPEFKPLNTRRNGAALRTPAPRAANAPPLSTPKLPASADQIAPPVFLKSTQPAVVAVAKTPAAGDVAPPPVEPAVAAQATPKPEVRARLKKEPTAPKASAGDVRVGINDSGTLVIAIDDDTLELNPKQARRLGHFMAGTHGIWNPF